MREFFCSGTLVAAELLEQGTCADVTDVKKRSGAVVRIYTPHLPTTRSHPRLHPASTLKIASTSHGPAMSQARLADALTRLAADKPIHDALRGVQYGPPAGPPLADALRSCKTAHRALNLYGLALGNEGAVPILEMLGDRPGCTSLDIGANNIGIKSAARLGPLLLLSPPLDPDDDFTLPGEDAAPASVGAAKTPIRELRLARSGPSFDGKACAALLAPLIQPEGTLALATLGLAFNPLGSAGGVALGAAMQSGRLPHLQHLQLFGCGLGADGATALARGLPNTRALAHLDLSDNGLGEAGGCAVASELHMIPSLTELLLARNQLGDTAAHALATALVKRGRVAAGGGAGGCRLVLLCLSHNGVRNAGAAALADALGASPPHGNRTLTRLELRANKLSQPALVAFGDALVSNPKLTALDLSANRKLSDEDIAALRGLLKQNQQASRGVQPAERVAPNEHAAALVDASVLRLFSQPPHAAYIARRALTGGQSARGGGGGASAAWVSEDAIAREARQLNEVTTALSGTQEDLASAAREVARLRQREATLEAALRREGMLRGKSDDAVERRPLVTLT